MSLLKCVVLAAGLDCLFLLAPVAFAETAKVLQHGQTFSDCPDCPKMTVIPAGSFEMGSLHGDSEAKPMHRVTISRSFAIGKTEVTQGQWRALMGNNPSHFNSCGDDCPVERVSWDDAQEFISHLNQKTGKQYRLPTEAEWEYACRAGRRQAYCGSNNLDSVGWYNGNSGTHTTHPGMTTHPTGRMQANAFGLYDMSGNVWEWVEDSDHGNYAGAPTDGSAWQGDGAKRVLRGGSWSSPPQGVHADFRSWSEHASRNDDIGFRLARTLP